MSKRLSGIHETLKHATDFYVTLSRHRMKLYSHKSSILSFDTIYDTFIRGASKNIISSGKLNFSSSRHFNNDHSNSGKSSSIRRANHELRQTEDGLRKYVERLFASVGLQDGSGQFGERVVAYETCGTSNMAGENAVLPYRCTKWAVF